MELFQRTVCLNLGEYDTIPPCSCSIPPPELNFVFPIFPISPVPTTRETTITISTGTTSTRSTSPNFTVTSPDIGEPVTPTEPNTRTPNTLPPVPPTPASLGLILGLTLPFFFLGVLCVVFIVCRRRQARGKTTAESTSPDPMIPDDGKTKFPFSGFITVGLSGWFKSKDVEEEIIEEETYFDHKLDDLNDGSAAEKGTGIKAAQNGGGKVSGKPVVFWDNKPPWQSPSRSSIVRYSNTSSSGVY